MPAGEANRRILGAQNPERQAQNPDLLTPPKTDHGTLPNLRFAYADTHRRLEAGGWTREITTRELPISTSMAGVNMRLNAGGGAGAALAQGGRVGLHAQGQRPHHRGRRAGPLLHRRRGEGDLWYFPPGIPHSIQGLQSDGCEFLLVFDNGSFSEDSTFMLTDWVKHVPRSVLAKNFGLPETAFDGLPKEQLYIFQAPLPAADAGRDPAGRRTRCRSASATA